MPRYIDADKLLNRHHQYFEVLDGKWYVHMEDIENAPAEDVVEVVRCRDCEYWDPGSPLATVIPTPCRCRLRREDFGMTAEDFCSYGRRRKEDG